MQQGLEKKLIKKAQSGDKVAFAEIFRLHYSFLYKYLLKNTMNKETTEDIIQETMLKCYKNIHQYKYKAKFSSWLITIATRTYIDLIRRSKVEQKWLEDEQLMLTRQLKWEIENKGLEWITIMDEMAKLAPETRSAILLVHYYGFTYEEAGDILKLKTGTVKSKVHYGITKLRKELRNDEN